MPCNRFELMLPHMRMGLMLCLLSTLLGCSWGTAVYEVSSSSSEGELVIAEERVRYIHEATLDICGADILREDGRGFFATHVEEADAIVTYDRMPPARAETLQLSPTFDLWDDYGLWFLLLFALLIGVGANLTPDEAEEALKAQGGLLEAQVILFLFTAFVDQDLDKAVMKVVLGKVRKYSPTSDDKVLETILRLSLRKLADFQGETREQRVAFVASKVQVVKAGCTVKQRRVLHEDLQDLVAADGDVSVHEREWLEHIARSLELSTP